MSLYICSILYVKLITQKTNLSNVVMNTKFELICLLIFYIEHHQCLSMSACVYINTSLATTLYITQQRKRKRREKWRILRVRVKTRRRG